jgi:molybdopterin converting factor small subunit
MKHAVDLHEGTVEVSDGATVGDLLRILSGAYGEEVLGYLFEEDHTTIRNDVLILVNDTDIGALDGLDTLLSENDEVILMPISHGG